MMQAIERLERRVLLSGGELDPGFANGTTSYVQPGDDAAYAVLALSDGGYITAGKTFGSSVHGVALARYGGDGSPLTSFGNAGQVFVPFDGYDRPVVLAVQPDGKILLGGSATETAEFIRFLPNGKLDDSFGSGGIVVTDLGNGFDQPLAIRVRPDGRILVLGGSDPRSESSHGLVQFDSAGNLDKSFGSGGSVDLANAQISLSDIELLPDGRIMGVGSNSGGSIVVRLDARGRFDPTFGGAGKGIELFAFANFFTRIRLLRDGSLLAATFQQNYVTLQHRFADGHYGVFGSLYFPGNIESISDIIIQRGGDIVICADVQSADAKTGQQVDRLAVGRFDLSGFPDSSFGENGIAMPDLPPVDGTGGTSIALLPRGRMVVTAPADYRQSPRDFKSAGLTRNGQIDSTMGNGGYVTSDILSPVNSSFDSIAPLPDGRFLAVENIEDERGGVRVLRYQVGGQLDTSFYGGIPLDIEFGPSSRAISGAIVVSPGGDRFAVVSTLSSTDINAAPAGGIAMFNADGSPDEAFGKHGLVTFRNGDASTYLNIGLFQGDKFLAAGMIGDAFAIARFKRDGSLDKTFGDAGVTITRFNPNSEQSSRTTQIVDLAFDKNGDIVALGNDNLVEDLGGDNALAVARYTADGKLDLTFGQGGKGGGLDSPTAWHGTVTGLRIQADGKIDVIGSSIAIYPATLNSAISVLRFGSNGLPDQTFGNGGRAEVDFSAFVDDSADVFIQPDGKLVLVGTTHYDGPYADAAEDIALARLDRNGKLDPTFGSGGKATLSLGNADEVRAAFIRDNGQIIVAGDSDHQPFLAAYTAGEVTARLDHDALIVTGTGGADAIRLRQIGGRMEINDALTSFDPASFSRIQIDGLAGDDTLDASASPVPVTFDGGAGNDVLFGGRFADLLKGSAGNDTLFGGGGPDTLRGGDGNDYLNGGPGADQIFGDGGNDQIFAIDGTIETIDGGDGFDRAKGDANDLLTGIDALLA